MAKEKFDAYQVVTDQIVKALEAGTRPWTKNWAGGSGGLPLRHKEHNVRDSIIRAVFALGVPYLVGYFLLGLIHDSRVQRPDRRILGGAGLTWKHWQYFSTVGPMGSFS